jgi:heme-degrading monooxygenase HmoA
MYAVIFRAEINELDAEYSDMTARMRELALNDYGCLEFFSTTDGSVRVAISYWPDLDSIKAWKNNIEHQQAQALGKSRWYRSYQVQVVEVLREYRV